jgi:hypothetical protein
MLGGTCVFYALTAPTIETVFSMGSVQSAYKRSEFRSKCRRRRSEVRKLVVEEELEIGL